MTVSENSEKKCADTFKLSIKWSGDNIYVLRKGTDACATTSALVTQSSRGNNYEAMVRVRYKEHKKVARRRTCGMDWTKYYRRQVIGYA